MAVIRARHRRRLGCAGVKAALLLAVAAVAAASVGLAGAAFLSLQRGAGPAAVQAPEALEQRGQQPVVLRPASCRAEPEGCSSRRGASGLLPLLLLVPIAGAVAPRAARAIRKPAGDPLTVVKDCRQTVADLVANYEAAAKKGGDEVRRYLGTVGSDSPLTPGPGMKGALQDAYLALAESTGDLDMLDYAEQASGRLREADSLAYSSNFANFSSMNASKRCGGGDCQQVFLKEAKQEVVKGLAAMDKFLAAAGAAP